MEITAEDALNGMRGRIVVRGVGKLVMDDPLAEGRVVCEPEADRL
jgi:hypothetical protein